MRWAEDAGSVHGPRRRRIVAFLGLTVLLGVASCRSLDENVLDERMRAATVDAYLSFIEDEFGGFATAGTSLEGLRDRHRSAAVAATRPEDFYGTLRRMVVDLDDPHATLVASERFWKGPVALPEQLAAMFAGDDVWLALPGESVRTPAQLSAALEGWLEGVADAAAAGDPAASAQVLVRSAIAQAGAGAPLRWMILEAVDGVPVRSPHGALLLLEGALGSCVQVTGTLDGARVTLGLFRNSGKIRERGEVEFEGPFGPRRLARILDPEVPLPRRPWSEDLPYEAQRSRRQELLGSAEAVGEVERDLAREYGLEARVLTSPGGREVGYLRIEDFSRSDWPGGTIPPDRDAQFLEGLGTVMEALTPYETWVVDLTQNHGGRWLELGSLLSFFLPVEIEVLPHEVRAWMASTRWGFIPTMERVTAQQGRVEVPCVLPRRLFVLVDQGTGSSAEILACALRHLAGATLVGERTVGAELAVTTLWAPDGSRFTVGGVGGMLEPCEHFQGRGVEPDLLIRLPAPDRAELGLGARREALRMDALRKALAVIDGATP